MDTTNKPFRFLYSVIDSPFMGHQYDLTGCEIDYKDLDYRKAFLKENPNAVRVMLSNAVVQLPHPPPEKPPNISQTLSEVERFAACKLPKQEWIKDVKDRTRKYEQSQW